MKTPVRHAVAASAALSALLGGCVTAVSAHADAAPSTGRTRIAKGTETTATARIVTDGDTFTSSTSPTTANGSSPDLRAGNGSGSTKVGYLHFTVPAGDVGHVRSASLVLTRTAHHLPDTTVSARPVTGSWTETALTAATAPATGAPLDTETVGSTTNTVSLDVTSAVTGHSSASFAVTSPVTDDVAMFDSREAGVAAPTLVLSLVKAAAPAPSRPSCGVSATLVSSCRVWLGDAPQAYGSSRVPSQAGRLAIDETFTGRKFDILHQYKTNGQLFPDADTIGLANQGRTLLINWKPATDMSWAKVAAGGADARIDAEAAYLKAHFNRPFMLTIYHEPEDNVNLTPGSGMTPADYVAMYRHTVARLHADGATMFSTVMNYMGYYRWDSMRDTLYPGDDVVDWIAWDPYMHYPSAGKGGDFASLVNTAHGTSPGFYDWATTRHPGKPLMLAEWGVYDDHLTTSGVDPAAFYASVASELPHFPALKALVYFTMNPVDVPAGGATSPTVTAAGLAAWRTLAQAPILNGTSTVVAGRYQGARIGTR